MTKYLAGDFARARFATHPDGRIAARVKPDSEYPWSTVMAGSAASRVSRTDAAMEASGWVPVQEQAGSYTRTDECTTEQHLRLRTVDLAAVIEDRDKARRERDQLQKDRTYYRDYATEQEKDIARLMKERDDNAQPRALTPADIKSLVLEREQQITRKIREAHDRDPRPSSLRIAAAVYQGLTEPTRPEGAEELEAWLDGMPESIRLNGDEHQRSVADYLAERGVRVTGAES